jgi:hypothetical protein
MDRLASCYFCGTALDDEVTERSVVPERLATDDHGEATVVVCRGCDRKLDRVLAAVVNAVTNAERDTPGDGIDSHAEAGPTDDAALADDPEEVLSSLSMAEQTEGPTGDDDRVDDTDEGATSDAEDRTPERDDAGTTDIGRNATDRAPTDSGSERDEDSSAEADDGSDGPAAETTVSALEYNKVMRLLQNREFPVDRAEIEEVAASAYQISPETCHRVIDEAIERDLLAERDGEIVPKK